MSYEGYVRKHYKPVLGQVRLTELVPQMLQQFYNYKVDAEGLSPKTIVNMNLCLHKCLDQAVKENLIVSNPASSLNLPRLKRADIEILTRDEQAILMRASYHGGGHRLGQGGASRGAGWNGVSAAAVAAGEQPYGAGRV